MKMSRYQFNISLKGSLSQAVKPKEGKDYRGKVFLWFLEPFDRFNPT